MLPYLEDRIPYPDLIILDENLKAGFMLEDTCNESQMFRVLALLKNSGRRATLVDAILKLSRDIATSVAASGVDSLFNGKPLCDIRTN